MHFDEGLLPSSVPGLPQDRDYSGCPCRSWNGIVEYRCEAGPRLVPDVPITVFQHGWVDSD